MCGGRGLSVLITLIFPKLVRVFVPRRLLDALGHGEAEGGNSALVGVRLPK